MELVFLAVITLVSWAAVLPMLLDSGRQADRPVRSSVAIATVPDFDAYSWEGLV